MMQVAEKKCESCGEPFGCGANSESCWCSGVALSNDAASEVRSKFSDCLCSKCLPRYSESAAMIVTYQTGATETISGAVRVDTQNFHEGMFDFYDERGNLLRQIGMDTGIVWESVNKKD